MSTRSDRDETPSERADRNLEELISEVRVALPGVQVLFAFLLVVPFNDRFRDLSRFDQRLYLATLLSATIAAALLIAPSINHRIEFGTGDKEHLVRLANRLTIAGLAMLAASMTMAVALVTNLVFSGATAVIVATSLAGLFSLLWFVMPVVRVRNRAHRSATRSG